MKTAFYFFAIAFCCLLNSCLDTEEKIVLNEDGSGVYSISINMDGMIGQLKAFAQQQDTALNISKKDTTIFLESYVDTALRLTAEDKALLHDASVEIHINDEKDEMSFTVRTPFKNTGDAVLLKTHLADAMSKLDFISKALNNTQGMQGENMQMRGNGNPSANPFAKGYVFSATANSVSNILMNKKFITDTLSMDSSMQMLKQMAPLFGDIRYTSTFVLPREAKHYSGSNVKISDDKKTISFSGTLTEILDKPELLEYRIEY